MRHLPRAARSRDRLAERLGWGRPGACPRGRITFARGGLKAAPTGGRDPIVQPAARGDCVGGGGLQPARAANKLFPCRCGTPSRLPDVPGPTAPPRSGFLFLQCLANSTAGALAFGAHEVFDCAAPSVRALPSRRFPMPLSASDFELRASFFCLERVVLRFRMKRTRSERCILERLFQVLRHRVLQKAHNSHSGAFFGRFVIRAVDALW